MNVQKFIITGRVPSKKNARNIFVLKGKNPRVMNLPSNKYAAWHVEAEAQIQQQFFACGSVEEIQMEWYFPDKRRCDLTNKAESILDLLVDTGVITDDSWQHLPRIMLEAKGIDRKNPRVIVWVKYQEELKNENK